MFLEDRDVESVDSLVDFFHAELDNGSQNIQNSFLKADRKLRCLVATVALGMGVDFPNVEYIVHWGPSASAMDYWQQGGRCARCQSPGTAYMYMPRGALNSRYVDKEMLDIVSASDTQCIRSSILNSLKINGVSDEDIEKYCGVNMYN